MYVMCAHLCNNMLLTFHFGIYPINQGVNTPDSILDISCLTPKDRADLEYMLSIGVDWVALSLFVQRPKDIVEIKGLIMAHNPARMHFLLISWPRLKSQVASMEIHL